MTAVVATVSLATGGPLVITSAPYEIAGGPSASGLDPGQTIFSRLWATSPYVAGGIQVMSTAGIVAETLKLYVYDASQAAIATDMAALIAAFTQAAYVLTFGLDAASYSWACYNADYQIDPFPMEALAGQRLGVTLDIPRSPVPLAGPV